MSRGTNWYRVAVALLFGVAFFFATYHLTESPPVWYDEGFYLQSAANLASYGETGLRLTPDFIEPSSKFTSVGYPLIYPLALWFKVFGISIASARSLMVLFILGFLVASYFLARRLFGTAFALATLALLATFPPLYGNGKSVLGEVPGLFYLVLFLFCFSAARSSSSKKYLWLIAGGLFAGLCVSTKPTFLLLLPAIAVGVFLEWRRGTWSLKELSIAIFAGVVPIVYWIFSQFQTNDSLFSILTEYANPYLVQDIFSIILRNIERLFADIGGIYLVVLMGIWISALVIRIRKGVAISSVEVISFVFALLTIGNYARTTGWYRYLFEAQIMSLLFLPHLLWITGESVLQRVETFVPTFGRYMPSSTKAVFALIVILTVLGGYQVLFSSWVAEAYQSHKTAFLEVYIGNISSSTSVFFYNTPEVAAFMSNGKYYQYLNPYELRGLPGEGWPIGKEQLTLIQNGEVEKIIALSIGYNSKKDTLFKSYIVEQTAYKYTFLQKKK